MKTLPALFVALLLSEATADPPSAEERKYGVWRVEAVGAWKVRTGHLADAAVETFGAEKSGCRFAYATQTVNEKWTLGMRLVDEMRTVQKDPASGYINERDKVEQRPAPVVFYLQGPKPGAVDSQETLARWTGKAWAQENVRVQKDGTVRLRFAGTEAGKVFIKWRGENLTFDMTDFTKVTDAVKVVRSPEKETVPAKPAPVPPRR